MTDDAKHMGSMSLIIDGVAHGFTVNGKTFVFLSVGFVPTLQGSVQIDGIDPDQNIADNRLTWDDVTFIGIAAAEALPGIFTEAFGPISHGPVSAHSTQASPGDNGQNGSEPMPSPLDSTRVGDFGKEGR
jgi:hypothetical protein